MTNETKKAKLITPTFRVSFPAVFTPRRANEQDANAVAKYSVQMIFDKTTDLTELNNAVRAAEVEKWGADKAKWPKKLTMPFRDGSEKDYDGYGPDVIFISASSKMKPGLVDENIQPIIEPSEFYGGCYARATVNAFAWEFMGKAGVSFGLRNIQKVKDGDPFGGGSKAENDFDAIPQPGASKAAPVGGAEDDGLGL
jgi:hypothetical protein